MQWENTLESHRIREILEARLATVKTRGVGPMCCRICGFLGRGVRKWGMFRNGLRFSACLAPGSVPEQQPNDRGGQIGLSTFACVQWNRSVRPASGIPPFGVEGKDTN